MTKSQKRDIATSATTLIFLVVSTTGILMYFHLFKNYTKDLHEILGLVFVVAVFFHVLFNFNSMKQYCSKKSFLGISIIVLLVSLVFIFNAPDGKGSKGVIVNKVFNANIEKSFLVFNDDINLAKEKLKKAGIQIENSKTIEEVANNNNTNSFKIVEIITQK